MSPNVKRLNMRSSIFILLLVLVVACAQRHERSATVGLPPCLQTRALDEAEIVAVALHAHDTMTMHPIRFRIKNITAGRTGTNWAVSVWLIDPGSDNPLLGDWSSEGEMFLISDTGKVLSYNPYVFP